MSNQQYSPQTPAAGAPIAPPGPPLDRRPELRLLLPEERTSFKTIFGSAGLTHVAFILLIMLVAWLRPDRQVQAMLPERFSDQIVWLEQPGPGGGGGGGGNESPEPPRKAEVPAVKPPEPEPIPTPTPQPEPLPEPEPITPEAPIVATNDVPAVLASAPDIAPATTSVGTGSGGGAGSGTGGGTGPGKGDGIGDGIGGGIGGGIYQVGNGVQSPTLLYRPKPQYTSEAMLRRIQGEVHLNCVVLATGLVGECEIVKSLDGNSYGLDSEALKAAKQFRFRAGTRLGEPVAVLVKIELEFNMR